MALASRVVRNKVLVGIAIAIALLAFVIFLPKWSFVRPGGLKNAVDRAKAESDLRGHLIQMVGGLVLALGAYFTWRTFRLNQEGQITERFTRAVEQLANKEQLDIRLGGIYALERIAHDSETHYEPVLEVLTAFLREHTGRQGPPPDEPPQVRLDPSKAPRLGVDFQAAATVLGRRDRSHGRVGYRLDLREVNLRSASLSNADFSGANLTGAYLVGAELSGADLNGADLTKANLSGARLSGNLSWAFLDGADLSYAVLSYADLEGARLCGADLSYAYLHGADLSYAVLDGADLSGARLTEANLSVAFLDGADLSGADLSTATGLGQGRVDAARVDPETTKLPPYIEFP
jgi:uncharacterized protein YjbI with pentapeptide repeats